MKVFFFALSVFGLAFFGMQDDTSAIGLKIAPLEYKTTLKVGELKKGFVIISNPSDEKVLVETSVQGFKQTGNNGELQFYDDERISAGVKLDLDSFELGPREAVQMYFLLDGKALPSGDVFGGIFFTTAPIAAKTGSGQSVRLGTLLSITNGTPGARKAEITKLTVPMFNLDSQLNGSYVIKNTGDPKTTTGFYPETEVSVWPFGGTKTIKGKLVFAGKSREHTFEAQTPPLGIYKVSVNYGASSQSKWVFVAHPIALIGLFFVLIGLWLLRKYRKRHSSVHIPSR